MKKALANFLKETAAKDKDLMLLTGDMGYGMFEPFQEEFPGQFLNCGIAEQNMVGVAAGMALMGKHPIVYSAAAFLTGRAWEQIKLDVAYQNLPIILIGGGGGYAYGKLGATHHCNEDLALMAMLPNMVVLNPCDTCEFSELIRQAYQSQEPTYIRMCRQDAELPKTGEAPKIGKMRTITDGCDYCLVATGTIATAAAEAESELRKRGIKGRFMTAATISPIDKIGLFHPLITVEEHNSLGLAAKLSPTKAMATKREPVEKVGNREELLKASNLTKDDIISEVLSCFPTTF